MFLCTPYVVCFSGISLLIPHARIKWLFIDDTPCTARRTHYPCSAKSELLRTLVTALAVTHSPDQLNLVLVDFKGGATFLGCESLPHTSAVITNLEDEATLVERMYDAISGEMHRRQELLRRAGNFANVGDYTAAREAGAFDDPDVDDPGPLAALVIIVDEFSELLGQHPDFAELFVAVGRLGRSLHVHLLLASQRLEEGKLRGLDSHLSYRLGLRTFSAAESRQVLGATDAYHLSNQPGAGFLKTDAEDLTKFQASYVSGPLQRRVVPSLRGDGAVATSPAPRVELFTGWEDTDDTAPEAVYDDSTTVLAEVVQAAREEAHARGQKAHRIWLPPLPAAIRLPDVVRLYEGGAGGSSAPRSDARGAALRCAVGIIDRPYRQRQDPLVIDFTEHGGHLAICGGPQAGKSSAVRTIAAALAAHHTPDEARMYVLDLGGGGLTGLQRLPHVSGVAARAEAEKVRRVIDEVIGIIADAQQGTGDTRDTFLFVDGWHHIGTAGADFEDLAEKCTAIAADGPAARVHLVVTTPRWTTMRPSIRDLIGTRLELRLGEAMDSLIDRKKQQKLPAAPGRGITGSGEYFLFAQTATEDLVHLAATAANTACPPAPALKMLPRDITVANLPAVPHTANTAVTAELTAQSVTWGIGGPRLDPVAWDPSTDAHLVCVGASSSGKSTFISTIAAGISARSREEARLVVIDHRRAHLGEFDESMVAAYAASSSATEKALRDTAATLSARLPGPEVTASQLARRDWWEGPDIYVVIDDFDLVSDMALHPLVELIPHARDIGLHIVMARKAGGINRALFGKFFAGLRDAQPAVFLMDADKDEGPIFGIKPTHQPPGRGTWIVRGTPVGLCQSARPTEGANA